MVLLEGSITGVETIPICVNAVVPEQPWTLTGTAVAPDGSRLFIHSAEVVPEFASKAYTVSFIVATYTTLCSPLLGMFTSGKYKGCPTTNPSTDLSLIHISEPTRLLSISYAVFCLKKK